MFGIGIFHPAAGHRLPVRPLDLTFATTVCHEPAAFSAFRWESTSLKGVGTCSIPLMPNNLEESGVAALLAPRPQESPKGSSFLPSAPAIFIVGRQEPLHILPQHEVRRRNPDLRRRSPSNPYLLLLPHPVFQVRHLQRRYVHRRNPAAQRRFRRSPRFRSPLLHLPQRVVRRLPVPLL